MVTGAPPRSLSAPVTVRNLVSVADITFYYCTALWVVYDAKRDGMLHFISLLLPLFIMKEAILLTCSLDSDSEQQRFMYMDYPECLLNQRMTRSV